MAIGHTFKKICNINTNRVGITDGPTELCGRDAFKTYHNTKALSAGQLVIEALLNVQQICENPPHVN